MSSQASTPAASESMALDDEVRALIGTEYVGGVPGTPITGHPLCTMEGGGKLEVNGASDETWWMGMAECLGRSVLMLERPIERPRRRIPWRVFDALLLPPLELESVHPDALTLAYNGICELKGRTDTSFVALVRWHGREQVDWRTGVEQAWTFDLKAGRIVSLPTRNIVCYAPDP